MATAENSLAFSYKVNHTHDLAISLSGIYPKEKKTHAQKDSDSNVHSSIIRNSFKLETQQSSMIRTLVDGQPSNMILLSDKKEPTTDPDYKDAPQQH